MTPASRKGLLLLYFLAVERRPVTRAEISELLWGHVRASNVRQELYMLSSLEGAQTWLEVGACVELHASTDLQRFHDLVREGDPAAALALCGRAPVLLEGVDAAGVSGFEDWLHVERARFLDAYLGVLHTRCDELERDGRAGAAIDALHRLLALDPLNESAHRAVMRLEFRRGRFQAALAQYDRCRKVLHEELDVAPLPETRELARMVTAARWRDVVPGGAVKGRGRMPETLLRPPVLVGRERVWQTMEDAWADRKTIFLSGPPGVGKSRLMVDFARSKGRYLLLNAFPRDRDVPYAVANRALGVVLRSLPEITVPSWVADRLEAIQAMRLPTTAVSPGTSLPGGGGLEAAWLALMGRASDEVASFPGDDVHDFDQATSNLAMALTRHFATAAGGTSAGLLAAFRADEASPAFLESVKAAVAAGAAVWLQLEALDASGVEALIESTGIANGSELVERVYSYTGGNPLFVLEVLKGIWSLGYDDDGPPEVPRLSPTERLRFVVNRRLDRHSAAARSTLGALAVLAPDHALGMVSAVAERPVKETVDGLEVLEAEQLVDGMHVVHGLVRDVVLASMSAAERRYRHRLAATAYQEAGGPPARVAAHFERAGEILDALRWWERAARDFEASDLRSGLEHATARIERLRAELHRPPDDHAGSADRGDAPPD